MYLRQKSFFYKRLGFKSRELRTQSVLMLLLACLLIVDIFLDFIKCSVNKNGLSAFDQLDLAFRKN